MPKKVLRTQIADTSKLSKTVSAVQNEPICAWFYRITPRARQMLDEGHRCKYCDGENTKCYNFEPTKRIKNFKPYSPDL